MIITLDSIACVCVLTFVVHSFAGDIDDSVFIVQSGCLNVMINNSDGSSLSLKHVRRGESVTSLLSFIDVLAVNGR